MTRLERILITRTPLAFVLNRTKKLILPGFEGVPLYDVIRFFYLQVKAYGLTERASSISYNFIMAIPPSLLFLFTLIPNLPFISKHTIQQNLHSIIYDIVPSNVYNRELIRFVDSFIYESRFGLLSFGLLLSLFFSSNAMMALMRSFNKKNYIGFGKRMGIVTRWTAIKLTIIIFGLFFGYFILLISQGALLKMLVKTPWLREAIAGTRWIFIVLLILLTIGYIFKYAPAVEKKWRLLSPGTLTTTFLSIISSVGFSIFVNNFGRYNVLYGSIGTVMMIMALIYINSLAILIGFELNVSINALKIMADQREAEEKKSTP